jgi:hypothetical protein
MACCVPSMNFNLKCARKVIKMAVKFEKEISISSTLYSYVFTMIYVAETEAEERRKSFCTAVGPHSLITFSLFSQWSESSERALKLFEAKDRF